MTLAHHVITLRESEFPCWARRERAPKHFQAHPWILWKAHTTLYNSPFYLLQERNLGRIEALTHVCTQMHIAGFY